MSKVGVIGCGSWGTAMAVVLAGNGETVQMWCRRQEQADEMNGTRENKKYLAGVVLPEGIQVHTDLQEVLTGAESVSYTHLMKFKKSQCWIMMIWQN